MVFPEEELSARMKRDYPNVNISPSSLFLINSKLKKLKAYLIQKSSIVAVKVHSAATGQGETRIDYVVILHENCGHRVGVLKARDVPASVEIRLQCRADGPGVSATGAAQRKLSKQRVMAVTLGSRPKNVSMLLRHCRAANG